MAVLLASLDEVTVNHLRVALGRHRSWLREQGLAFPKTLAEVEEVLREASSSARAGQEATELERNLPRAHAAPMSPPLLDSDAAAACLGVSRRTLQRIVRTGDLPTVDGVGRGPRFRPEDIEAFIESRMSSSGGAA